MRKLCLSPPKKQKNKQTNKSGIIFSLSWNIVYWLLKSSCFKFFGDEKYGLFEPNVWWKYDIYWLLKSSCFEPFGDGKYALFSGKMLMERLYIMFTEKFLFWAFRSSEIRSFSRQKVDGNMIFTEYWKILVLGNQKVLVLNFAVMGKMGFF